MSEESSADAPARAAPLWRALSRRALGGALLGTLLPFAAARAETQARAAPRRTADGVAELGDALVRSQGLVPRSDGYVVSPYNLHATLGLLALGARGATRTDFAERLAMPAKPEVMAAAIRDGRVAVSGLNSDDTRTIMAYSGWSRRGHPFTQAWQKNAKIAADAHLAQLDFASAAAVPAINDWVKTATQGEVPKALEQLDGDTELVLAGAIYFAGKWATAFPEASTAPAAFHRLDGGTSDVPMMANQLSIGYGARGAGHAVRLPYRGGKIALWVATARRREDSGGFLDEVATAGISKWLRGTPLTPQTVALRFPRLSLSAGGEMLPALRAISFDTVLSGDFPGLLDRPVRPSQVAHQARIRIDEAGTVAAAATAIVGSRKMTNVEEFTADRPFVFVLAVVEPWMPLFMGYVGDAARIS